MKRAAIIMIILSFAAAALFAESLVENEFYAEGERLLAEAEAAFDIGDYDAAADYAARAEEQFALSDEYVEKALMAVKAQEAIDKADARLAWAKSVDADKRFPELYKLAEDDLDAANVAIVDEEFDNAVMYAESSMAYLDGVTEAQTLPGLYTVVLNLGKRDCLWRIAGLAAIYNDPFKWEKLYQANRKAFVDPNNPDLIVPGQVLVIPSLKGEKRQGMYDPKAAYEPLK